MCIFREPKYSTLCRVLLLDNVIQSQSHSCTQFICDPLKYSGYTFTICVTTLKNYIFCFEAFNKIACVLKIKLSHSSNIRTRFAPDGANSVMSSAYETRRHKGAQMSGNSKHSKNKLKIYVIIFALKKMWWMYGQYRFLIYSVNESSYILNDVVI